MPEFGSPKRSKNASGDDGSKANIGPAGDDLKPAAYLDFPLCLGLLRRFFVSSLLGLWGVFWARRIADSIRRFVSCSLNWSEFSGAMHRTIWQTERKENARAESAQS